MNKDKFNGIMARAQQLMLDENFNRQVDMHASTYSEKNTGVYGGDFSSFEAQAFGGGVSESKEPVMIIQDNQSSVRGLDALPECMRESFKKMPPIQGDMSDVNPVAGLEKNLSLKPNNRRVVNENIIPNVGGSVDYSLIKTIIDESVARHLKTINESSSPSLKGMRIMNGNTIQLLDNKGNLYEGVLKLKKKAVKN